MIWIRSKFCIFVFGFQILVWRPSYFFEQLYLILSSNLTTLEMDSRILKTYVLPPISELLAQKFYIFHI